MALPVFKTGEAEYLGLAGSIPVRLRQRTVEGIRAVLPDPRRAVPRTDTVLADARLVAARDRLGRARVQGAVSNALEQVRRGRLEPDAVVDAVLAALPPSATTLLPVLNATGVVLHTNLGRAPLSRAAIEAIVTAAGYVDVEFDLADGVRASRGRATLEALRRAVPDAGDALVVNNGAAALVLATTALAAGREVVISRGEMVEIGDGFRLHELIESTGARLREVGTTNRVTVTDYAAAVGSDTGCILKVHPSNFRVLGFASAVPVRELARLPAPLVVDIGSGLLSADPMLPAEPDAATTLRDGATILTCSGDKLLGGPQAGIVLGDADVIERLRRHPLARALRVDKLTLAALEATIDGPPTPTYDYLHHDNLRERCDKIVAAVDATVHVEVVAAAGAVGGGAAPGLELPGWAVALPVDFAERLRAGEPAVVGRIERDLCLLDLRCVPPAEDARVIDAIRVVAGR